MGNEYSKSKKGIADEDRLKHEDIWQMLSPVEGIIINEKIIGLDLVKAVKFETSAKSMRDRAKLKSDKFRLSYDIAAPV